VLVYEKEKGQPRVKKHGIENVGALIVDGILSKVEAAVAIKERMKIGSEGVVIVEAIFDEKQSAWLVDTVMLGVVTDSSQSSVSQTLNGLIARMLNENTASDQKEIEQSIASTVKDYLKGMNQYPEVVVRLNSI